MEHGACTSSRRSAWHRASARNVRGNERITAGRSRHAVNPHHACGKTKFYHSKHVITERCKHAFKFLKSASMKPPEPPENTVRRAPEGRNVQECLRNPVLPSPPPPQHTSPASPARSSRRRQAENGAINRKWGTTSPQGKRWGARGLAVLADGHPSGFPGGQPRRAGGRPGGQGGDGSCLTQTMPLTLVIRRSSPRSKYLLFLRMPSKRVYLKPEVAGVPSCTKVGVARSRLLPLSGDGFHGAAGLSSQ